MKKIPILSILSISFFFFISCDNDEATPSLDKEIARVAQSHIIFGRTPGVAIGTYHDGIEKKYFFGTKNLSTGDEIDEFTMFEIGSITKTFTALLFADFVNENQISLTDTIENYFPYDIYVPEKDSIKISFLNLLNHTSGIPRDPDNQPEEQPAAEFSETDLISYFNDLELKSIPGTNYEYSNLGMGLAGYLLGKFVEKDYKELLNERILIPMGMDYTTCNAADFITTNIAQGYYGNSEADFYLWSDILAPAGTIKSNLHDMMLYLKENIDYNNSSLKDALILTKNRTFEVNEHFYIGLGWHLIIDGDGYEIFWHNGGTRGFSSFIAYNNTTKDGVVVLINSYCFGEQDIIGIEVLNLLAKY